MVPAADSKTMICLLIMLKQVPVHQINTTEHVLAAQTTPVLIGILASGVTVFENSSTYQKHKPYFKTQAIKL